MRGAALVSGLALSLAGCAPHVVSVLSATQGAAAERPMPLHVMVESTAVRLPLPVGGANVAFSGVDRALLRSTERAFSPILSKLGGARRFEVIVELIEARAEYSGDQMVITLETRATLRATVGNAYIAQTHAHASATASGPPERGQDAVRGATDAIGKQLAGWLLGQDLEHR